MSTKTHYEILQVHPEASPEVIKAAYKSLSTKFHPDRDKSADAAGRFAEIQKAFDVLSDADRRRQYDADLARGLESTSATSGSSVVFRVDGTSTFLTLDEHHRRGWQEAAACDLSNHDFSGVSFKDAKLAKAKLDGSRFNGCDFRGADLTDCSAKDCQFDKADFAGAKLTKCEFSQASLIDSNLKCSDLRQLVVLRTNLQRAQMQGCNVGGVDLSSCNLVDANLTGCVFDDSTKFTVGYPVPKEAVNWDAERRRDSEETSRVLRMMLAIGLVLLLFIVVFAAIQR